jgi:hypothetical protein
MGRHHKGCGRHTLSTSPANVRSLHPVTFRTGLSSGPNCVVLEQEVFMISPTGSSASCTRERAQ